MKWARNWGNIKAYAYYKETEKEMCEIFLNRDSVYSFLGNVSNVYEIVRTNLISSKNLMEDNKWV